MRYGEAADVASVEKNLWISSVCVNGMGRGQASSVSLLPNSEFRNSTQRANPPGRGYENSIEDFVYRRKR